MNAAVWFSSLAGLAALAATPIAEAQPSRVIILRHAEKLNAYALCDLGRERADALAKQFLGQGATQSLFDDTELPAYVRDSHPSRTVMKIAVGLSLILRRRRIRIGGVPEAVAHPWFSQDVLRVGRIVFNLFPKHLHIRPEVFEFASVFRAPHGLK